MSPTEDFAVAAEAFAAWLTTGTDTGPAAARAALGHVVGLYAAALALPPPGAGGAEEALQVDDVEWRAVFRAAGRVPLDYYGVVHPLPIPPEEPSIGSLSDDLADIYRDVVNGLRAYQAGDVAEAVWQWAWGFEHHWGRHAAEAIGAMHVWLEENAPNQFTAG